MASPPVDLPKEWLKILQENARLRVENASLLSTIALIGEVGDMTQAEWRSRRHPAATGEDNDFGEGSVCSHCGSDVEDGVCVFDARDGEFVPGYMAEFDFFCNHECLSRYGRGPQVEAQENAME
jgi:hypothetical protein